MTILIDNSPIDKLYLDDLHAIKIEKYLRVCNEHIKPCFRLSAMRRNDYVEFLRKCSAHALKVGDKQISIKIDKELVSIEYTD